MDRSTLSSGRLRSAAALNSSSETAALFERWRRHGDRAARQELIGRYLPLARKLA